MIVNNKICFKSKYGSNISNLELPAFLKPKFTFFKPYYDEKSNLIYTKIDKESFDSNVFDGYIEKDKIVRWTEENNLIITSEYEEQ